MLEQSIEQHNITITEVDNLMLEYERNRKYRIATLTNSNNENVQNVERYIKHMSANVDDLQCELNWARSESHNENAVVPNMKLNNRLNDHFSSMILSILPNDPADVESDEYRALILKHKCKRPPVRAVTINEFLGTIVEEEFHDCNDDDLIMPRESAITQDDIDEMLDSFDDEPMSCEEYHNMIKADKLLMERVVPPPPVRRDSLTLLPNVDLIECGSTVKELKREFESEIEDQIEATNMRIERLDGVISIMMVHLEEGIEEINKQYNDNITKLQRIKNKSIMNAVVAQLVIDVCTEEE